MKTEEIEHTPGPWREDPGSLTDMQDGICIMGSDGDFVCETLRRDATLIAKAPDMLSALKAIQHLLRFGEPSKAAKVAEEVLGEIEQS